MSVCHKTECETIFCRYLKIVKSEGFEISQPALDHNSTEIHHKITLRSRTKKFHRLKLFLKRAVFVFNAFGTYLQHDAKKTQESLHQ